MGGLTERQYSRFPKCECRITSLLGLFSIDLDLGSILGHSGLHLGALACCPKLLTHRRVCCVCESMDMDMAEQVRRCPPVPNFAQCFEQIPNLGRRLRVACPCIGIHACGFALGHMGVPADSNNIFDLEESYATALTEHLTDMGMNAIRLNLGKVLGDLLRVDLSNLETPVGKHYIFAKTLIRLSTGAEQCTHWNQQSKHRSWTGRSWGS